MTKFDDSSDVLMGTASQVRDRVIEIILFLLGEMQQDKQLAEIDLFPLSSRGFSQSEIATAISWLFDKIAGSSPTPNTLALETKFDQNSWADALRRERAQPVRIYHEAEQGVIQVDARGYLLQLRELGLLTESELESVIDRVMMAGVPTVSLEEIKELVAMMAFSFDDSTRPGSRLMLNGSDRIQ